MTERESQRVVSVHLSSPLTVLKTDVMEVDFKRKQVRLVNNAGKVKAVTTFYPEVDNGTSLTAGS